MEPITEMAKSLLLRLVLLKESKPERISPKGGFYQKDAAMFS